MTTHFRYCTGYQQIVDAVKQAAERLAGGAK